jgi:hypothetical protein
MMLVEYTLIFKTLETHFIVVAPPKSFFLLQLFLKQELKKIIWNVHKMFYTYGYHGNIFPPKFFKSIAHFFHDNMCITFFEHSWYFFLHSCFKNNIKKNVLDLKIFHFSQKFWKKYVVMATMIICVKHFVNIPDTKFLILTLKIITRGSQEPV